jgi:hypothetical protein
VQLRHHPQNHRAGIPGVHVIRRCSVTQEAHETGLPFLQVFRIRALGLHVLTPLAPSAMSMLLALQLYVAHMLSSDPSHLENAASDAYVGSHVCRTLQRPALQLVSHPSAQNSVNRQLGIASVNAHKPLALLCFFIEVPSRPHVHPSSILSPNISCAAVARRPSRHLPTSLLGVFLISLASLLGAYACLPLTCKFTLLSVPQRCHSCCKTCLHTRSSFAKSRGVTAL